MIPMLPVMAGAGGMAAAGVLGTRAGAHLQFNGRSIFECCRDGDLPTAAFLWEQAQGTYDILNSEDEEGVVPLHWAAYAGHLPLVRFLVLKGAHVGRKAGSEGTTAVQWAACGGHLAVIDFLMDKGSDVTEVETNGYSAAAQAVQHGHTLALHLMVHREPRLDPNAVDLKGHTLVHWAAYKGFLHTLRYCAE
eukprot:RCo021195